MAANLKYFYYAIGLSALLFAALAFTEGGVSLLPLAMVLAIMELAVSFDNAIVNAKVMERMSSFWRQAFITVGIFIAVFGMRFYLPIQIVSWLGGLTLSGALRLAYVDPGQFAQILISSHAIVSGFGGAFLMMIFLKYFIDSERDGRWLPGVESVLGRLGHLESVQILITGAAAGFTAYVMPGERGIAFFVAAMAGIGTHVLVDLIKEGLEAIDLRMQERSETAGRRAVATGGIGMFLYLEIFDASMSFDGVIAAFAITNNILVVAVGLGVGAVFVRSLTLLFFDTKSLAEYRYLEPGAFWAIGGLSAFMFVAAVTHVPEWIISAYGGSVIVVAFIHSVVANRGDPVRKAGLGLSEAVERKIGPPEASQATA
ncbi:DUF475 domain-containing protein [Methylobacterium sp. 37f]|uniref:DUF475 domain-containing protein n=1 Tax=Methylobacterium sp. 37f TaxID=2817058 RepID=UPI001FFDE804|nr:DUF475 domain-containing protein [Methylobacterium sp. 37f]MCK2055264.1 DUF475 domain-containing protein [Methylobacterium sp. 37f]